jgi:hypothetical protein
MGRSTHDILDHTERQPNAVMMHTVYFCNFFSEREIYSSIAPTSVTDSLVFV